MYGTVAKMRIKPGKEEELAKMIGEQAPEIPGFVFQHTYRLDNNPREYMLVVGFESKEAYRANAESPEQNARYEQYVELLDGPPEWNDGEIVFSFPE